MGKKLERGDSARDQASTCSPVNLSRHQTILKSHTYELYWSALTCYTLWGAVTLLCVGFKCKGRCSGRESHPHSVDLGGGGREKKVKSFCPVTTIPAWVQNNQMCGFWCVLTKPQIRIFAVFLLNFLGFLPWRSKSTAPGTNLLSFTICRRLNLEP